MPGTGEVKRGWPKYRQEHTEELLKILGLIGSDKKLLDDFLKDLLSPAEYREIALRWQIVKQLRRGVPHHEVAGNLHVAIGTVTRGARTILNPEGGFNRALRVYGKS